MPQVARVPGGLRGTQTTGPDPVPHPYLIYAYRDLCDPVIA